MPESRRSGFKRTSKGDPVLGYLYIVVVPHPPHAKVLKDVTAHLGPYQTLTNKGLVQ
jgi:hypothetical protein